MISSNKKREPKELDNLAKIKILSNKLSLDIDMNQDTTIMQIKEAVDEGMELIKARKTPQAKIKCYEELYNQINSILHETQVSANAR